MRVKPWWKRRHALLIAEAARRAGLSSNARLGGYLECIDHGHGGQGTVIEARFNMTTGVLIRAACLPKSGGKSVIFRVEGGRTSRQTADAVVAWIAAGRRAPAPKWPDVANEPWHHEFTSPADQEAKRQAVANDYPPVIDISTKRAKK